jgi:TctA family transporter
VGAYLIRGFWQDVILALAFGLLGYGFKRWKYPRAPLILGFILGELAEDYLHKSLGVYGFAFLKRPVVLILLAMVILSLGFTIYKSYQDKKKARGAVA